MLLVNLLLKHSKRNHLFYLSHRTLTGLNLWNEDLSTKIKHQLEDYWREQFRNDEFSKQDTSKDKFYVTSMFPYPSGFLHMGHVRVYTISDTVARFQRMNNKYVIHPIGWDAFGLPAENAAIERQVAPDKWTEHNIRHMKEQFIKLGCSFDWDRELATCDPHFYKWTQYIFLKLFDGGLAYQNKALVNWDPVDKTVLADEQVDENGCSWRSGAKVEKKLFKQWFIRTSSFAKNLLDGLEDPILHDWRDVIKLQKHWIGECNGVNFDFLLVNDKDQREFITLWTSKPEFLDHTKFIAVNDTHILARAPGIKLDINCKKLHTSVENPLNGEHIPIFVTSEIKYLPMTDSYVGIPDVLEEATNFAVKYNIPFEQVPQNFNEEEKFKRQQEICTKAINGKFGGHWTSAKLRDWLISRQRYWGTPIPIVHCDKCGAQPVPKDELPVELPKLSKLSEKGHSQLASISEWVNTTCPKCKGPAKRETDTMDTFVDSSWYYFRYLDPKNEKQIFDTVAVNKYSPVDLYIGGKEHAVLHLYYARFMSHFLHSLGLTPEREPFKRLLVQGMVMGRTYRLKGTGEYIPENKVEVVDAKRNKAVTKESGEPVVMAWEKMSKSKHNGVDPDDMFNEYGTDTTRLLTLADVAPTSHRNWNSNTFPGILNWQKRLWLTIRDFLKYRNNIPQVISDDKFKAHDDYMFDSRNYYVKGATFNYIVTQQLSIAISKQQGLTNSIRRAPPTVFAQSLQFERALASQIILLAPMAPSFAAELWCGFTSAPNKLNMTGEINWDKSVFHQKWPETDYNYNLDLVCQVNGCENCVVKMTRRDLEKLSKDEAVEIALSQKEVQSLLTRRSILDTKYTIYRGCDSVVNILTNQPPAKKENLRVESQI